MWKLILKANALTRKNANHCVFLFPPAHDSNSKLCPQTSQIKVLYNMTVMSLGSVWKQGWQFSHHLAKQKTLNTIQKSPRGTASRILKIIPIFVCNVWNYYKYVHQEDYWWMTHNLAKFNEPHTVPIPVGDSCIFYFKYQVFAKNSI